MCCNGRREDACRPALVRSVLAVLAGWLSSAGAAETIGFEDDQGFAAGADIAAEAGWKGGAPGAGTVSAEQASAGSQSLKIASSEENAFVRRAFAIPEKDVIFIDFDILPCADASESPAAAVDANGAALGFLKEKDHGRVYAAPSSEKEPATDTGLDFALDEDNGAQKWMRVTIRQDLKAKTWDLFLDGKLTLIDQPLALAADGLQGKGTFVVYGNPAGDAYLDNVTITSTNPLFPDADADGIPDAVEAANSLSVRFNDRNGDANGDGISNIESFARGMAIGASPTGGRKVLYVDGTYGSDACPGFDAYRMGNRGPKKTLPAALAEADDATVIVLLPADEAYTLVERERGGNATTNLIPIGDVNLKTSETKQ